MHESSQSIAHNPLIAQRHIFTPRGIAELFAEAPVTLLAHRARTGLGARGLEGGGKDIADLVYLDHGHTPGWYIHTSKQ